jgi:hypothetical protein
MARAATSPNALQGGFKESSPMKGFAAANYALLLFAEKIFPAYGKNRFFVACEE